MAGKWAGSHSCGRLIGVWLMALHGVLCSGVVGYRRGLTGSHSFEAGPG